MRIRFIHGRKYDIFCSKCKRRREAIVYRELFAWRAKMTCGHHRELGFTKPQDVLEAEGLMNQ